MDSKHPTELQFKGELSFFQGSAFCESIETFKSQFEQHFQLDT